MKKNLTEIVFILDRSGSMAGLEDDTKDRAYACDEPCAHKQKRIRWRSAVARYSESPDSGTIQICESRFC